MTMRTAQKYMRAAEWMADKSELGSYLTPNIIYLLSAKRTPEGVHEQVVERLERGLPAEPKYVRHVVHEAKLREPKVKSKKGKREARWERQRRKDEEERDRQETAAKAIAQEVAEILVNKLSEDEIDKIVDALGNRIVVHTMLREAIFDARQSHGDNVTAFPPKPWESKS